ncbi:MAG: hypothetical protein V1857_03805 [archaeon]
MAWLVDASYNAGHVTLTLLEAGNLEAIRWTDSSLPYYLTEKDQKVEPVRKLNLFTQNELTLHKVNYSRKPQSSVR